MQQLQRLKTREIGEIRGHPDLPCRRAALVEPMANARFGSLTQRYSCQKSTDASNAGFRPILKGAIPRRGERGAKQPRGKKTHSPDEPKILGKNQKDWFFFCP
jgi:hypothetical protein